jgi:ABC-2 type transport system ATP-binding protein
MTAMADDGASVLLSSHALAELDRVADYLVVLSGGEVRLDGETDDVLARHRMLTGPVAEADGYAGQFHVVQDRRGGAQAHQVGLAYLRSPAGPSLVLRNEPTEVSR